MNSNWKKLCKKKDLLKIWGQVITSIKTLNLPLISKKSLYNFRILVQLLGGIKHKILQMCLRDQVVMKLKEFNGSNQL